jgi:hypothetical protein
MTVSVPILMLRSEEDRVIECSGTMVAVVPPPKRLQVDAMGLAVPPTEVAEKFVRGFVTEGSGKVYSIP